MPKNTGNENIVENIWEFKSFSLNCCWCQFHPACVVHFALFGSTVAVSPTFRLWPVPAKTSSPFLTCPKYQISGTDIIWSLVIGFECNFFFCVSRSHNDGTARQGKQVVAKSRHFVRFCGSNQRRIQCEPGLRMVFWFGPAADGLDRCSAPRRDSRVGA